MSRMTIRRLLGPLAAFFVALGLPASAQDNPFAPSGSGSVSISASNVSANVALPANTPVALVCNAGTVNAFFKAGVGNTTAATASNFILLPGLCQTINVAAQTYIAAITSSGATTVWITQGRGNPDANPGALGSSGISLSGTGANNADGVASVATGLSSADVYNYLYNGTTWDRTRGDTTSGAWVNVKAMIALPPGTALIGKVGFDQTTPGTTNAVAPIAGQNGVIGGTGTRGATTQRFTLATDDEIVGYLSTLQAIVSSNRAAVNPISGQSGVQGGAGASTALTQRFAIATDANSVALNTTPTDANGNGVVVNPSTEALAGIVPVVTTALESNHVICAAACNFYGGYITTGATAGWLLLANATSAPTAGGAAIAPIACVLAPANQTTSISGPPSAPIRGSTGIVMVFSTSGCLTNTASTTAYFSGQAK